MVMVERPTNPWHVSSAIARTSGAFTAGMLMIALIAGCQPTTGTVGGTVTLDGKAVPLGKNSRGSIAFHPSAGQGAMATGVLDSTGRYQLSTGALPQVQPGKYQVTVSIVELMPRVEDTEQSGRLITPAKYGSAIDSGLQANVVAGLNEIKFDLESGSEVDAAAVVVETVPAEPAAATAAEIPTSK